jgi:protoporphyrin/coproporphyrin ferrochelatase
VPGKNGWDAVVLLQLGGPATLDEIEPFLVELLSDPRVIQLPAFARPFQPLLGAAIARSRVGEVRPRYDLIGGGAGRASPILLHTVAQAEGLGARLGKPVHVAMRCSRPRADDAVRLLQEAGAERVLLVPLYPHASGSTTGSALEDFAAACRRARYDGDVHHVASWGHRPEFIELQAQACFAATPVPEETHLVLSPHSLPRRYLASGDPYQTQVELSADLLRHHLGDAFASVRLGYQSAVGPVAWLGPSTQSVLRGLLDEGARRIAVCPFGFVSDHIETLYDIDVLYREQVTAGGAVFHRVPSFNASPSFLDLLARLTTGPTAPMEANALVPEANAWTR